MVEQKRLQCSMSARLIWPQANLWGTGSTTVKHEVLRVKMNILLSCFYESYYLTIYKYKNSWHFIIHLLNLQIQLSNTHALVQMSNWHFVYYQSWALQRKFTSDKPLPSATKNLLYHKCKHTSCIPLTIFFIIIIISLGVTRKFLAVQDDILCNHSYFDPQNPSTVLELLSLILQLPLSRYLGVPLDTRWSFIKCL